jgi:hypothetical protein
VHCQRRGRDSNPRYANATLDSQIRRVQDVINGVAHILAIATIGPDGRVLEGGATELSNGKIPAFGSFGPGRRDGRRLVALSGLIPVGALGGSWSPVPALSTSGTSP